MITAKNWLDSIFMPYQISQQCLNFGSRRWWKPFAEPFLMRFLSVTPGLEQAVQWYSLTDTSESIKKGKVERFLMRFLSVTPGLEQAVQYYSLTDTSESIMPFLNRRAALEFLTYNIRLCFKTHLPNFTQKWTLFVEIFQFTIRWGNAYRILISAYIE